MKHLSEKEWLNFQERVREINKIRDSIGGWFMNVNIKIKIIKEK